MPETFVGDLSQVKLFDIQKPLLTEKTLLNIILRGDPYGMEESSRFRSITETADR